VSKLFIVIILLKCAHMHFFFLTFLFENLNVLVGTIQNISLLQEAPDHHALQFDESCLHCGGGPGGERREEEGRSQKKCICHSDKSRLLV